MDRKRLFKTLTYLIFFILIVNFLANTFYWYYSIWYFDMPMHFLGGFWVGLAIFYFFPFPDKSIGPVFKILLLIFFIGIGWEVFELFFNNYLAQIPFNALDTASDIFFDLTGGLCAILYLWKKTLK